MGVRLRPQRGADNRTSVRRRTATGESDSRAPLIRAGSEPRERADTSARGGPDVPADGRGGCARRAAAPCAGGGFDVAEEDAFPLALEIFDHLGSPDPELRDELGMTALGTWVVDHGRFRPYELQELRRRA